MKKLFFLLQLVIVLTSAASTYAQRGCPVQLNEIEHAALMAKRSTYLAQAEAMRLQNSTYYVPLQLHIVCQTNGGGAKSLDDIFINICEMNEAYDSLGVQFYVSGNINYINNSNYFGWEYGGDEGDEMMVEYNVSNAINCYFVNEVTGLCGYAYFPGTGPNAGAREGGMVLINGCVGTANITWQHEMGHYLALEHTFDGYGSGSWGGWGGGENVARTGPTANCNTAGDGFCDTPADNMPDRWNCPYTGTELDPVGVPYNPDPSYFMSYASDDCASRFSNQQENAMVLALTNERPYLLLNPTPYLDDFMGTVTSILPASSAVVPANAVTFQWSSVPDVETYLLEVVRISGGGTDRLVMFINDTTYTAYNTFTEGLTYRWKVKPITRLRPCHPSTGLKLFTTGTPIVLSLNDADLEGTITVFPVPANATTALSLHINTTIEPDAKAYLYSSLGKLITVYDITQMSTSITSAQLAKGIYYIKVQNGEQVATKKIIIQ